MFSFISKKAGEAIVRIQSRLEGGESGWLSTSGVTEDEGGLSIADEAGDGSMSIIDDDDESSS